MSAYKYEFKKFWFYDFVKITTWWTWLLWLRPKKHFISETARKEYKKFVFRGGVLVASNHESFRDSVYLQVSLFLRHHLIISAKDVFDNMKPKKLLKLVGTMPINRETPSTSEFREIVDNLKKGYVVNIFPEGKVGDGESISEVKEGVILMAACAGVPILPCFMSKTNRIHFYYGEPLYLGKDGLDKDKRKSAAVALREELLRLKDMKAD